jgi:hypothetical protein
VPTPSPWTDFDSISQGMSKFQAPVSNIWSEMAATDAPTDRERERERKRDKDKCIPVTTKRHIVGVEVEKHSLLISAPHEHSGQSPAQAGSSLGKDPPEPIRSLCGAQRLCELWRKRTLVPTRIRPRIIPPLA